LNRYMVLVFKIMLSLLDCGRNRCMISCSVSVVCDFCCFSPSNTCNLITHMRST